MRLVPLDSPGSWAAAVAALPAAGPLPSRTVLVPSERHAHALRRALARSGARHLLAGTRFISPLTAATEVLEAAGVAFTPGEDGLRRARLLALFEEGVPLEHFDPALLRSTQGWEEAFAQAIGVLEAAGLAPSDLPRDEPHPRDLALVWSRVAETAGTSSTSARIQAEAARLLERDARAWPFAGPVLAAVTGHEDAVTARFLRALPEVTLAPWLRRPVSDRDLQRAEALFGPAARAMLERAPAARDPPLSPALSPPRGAREPVFSERELLGAYLFQHPSLLAAADRPRSAGPDGTVHVEEHPGVEAELTATAAWVERKVLEDGLPLEEIAVLVPVQDPLAQLVADRLEALPFEGGPLPVHVAGGVPASSTAAGARMQAVVRTLRAHLSAETLAPVLPALRVEAQDGEEPRDHLTHGEAMELAYGLGTVGGNAAHPRGALAWSVRAAARIAELTAALQRARRDEDSEAREAWRLQRTLQNLRAIRPALDALVGVAQALVEAAPLPVVWERLGAFLERWVLAPGEGAALPARLAESLAPACSGALARALAGGRALDVVEEHLAGLRVGRGRFGWPAIYVGTLAGAAGLDFGAVRVVGLCEGVLPSQPHESPVLPEAMRGALERASPGRVIPGAADQVSAQVHALLGAVLAARLSVAMSAPRTDLARTEREPAAVLIDVAAALARPHAVSGQRAAAVPDTAALRRDLFRPALEAGSAFRATRPVSDADWLDRVARVAAELPPAWAGPPVLALDRVDQLRSPSGPLGPGDGILGGGDPFPVVPGLAPERPISASALQQLLQCPRLFLMRRILGWDEPAGAPPLREVDALSFGSLLHRAVEAFYRAHGEDFVARKRSLAAWSALALAMSDAHFDELLAEYPLVGEGIRAKERSRLHEALRAFLDHDWAGAANRRYHGVELAFGEQAPLAISARGQTLHVRGYIDRVDVEGDATLVRDLKSGRSHPRQGAERGPTPVRDVQLGLYQLAAKKLAPRWKTPGRVIAAYVYASGRGEAEERAFRDDPAALEEATSDWLALAARLLAERAFAPTPDEEDCGYCPFQPVCGAGSARRAAEGLEEAEDGGTLARFRALKLGEGEEP